MFKGIDDVQYHQVAIVAFRDVVLITYADFPPKKV
jgi:hypothetical protein